MKDLMKDYEHLLTQYPYNMFIDMFSQSQAPNLILMVDLAKFSELFNATSILSSDERMVLYKRYHDGRTNTEIATTLNIRDKDNVFYEDEDVDKIVKTAFNKLKINVELGRCFVMCRETEAEKELDNLRSSLWDRSKRGLTIIKQQLDIIKNLRKEKAIMELKLHNLNDEFMTIDDIRKINSSYDTKLVDIPLEGVTKTAVSTLLTNGYDTIGDIAIKSKKELKQIPGIGSSKLIALIELLKTFNIDIPDEKY